MSNNSTGTQSDKTELGQILLAYNSEYAYRDMPKAIAALTAREERLVAEAKLQGWHEGRAAANNPTIQYGYTSHGKDKE